MKRKYTNINKARLRGDGHFIAVMMVIAIVVVLAVFFRQEISEWFRVVFGEYKNNTLEIFKNM